MGAPTIRSRALRTALLASALMSVAVSARAQDATWLANGSGDFNSAANWSPATVPTGTAFFDTSTQTNVTFSANTTIGGWTFNPGASSYNFATSGRLVQFDGAGIAVNSGSVTITNNLNPGGLRFLGTSTAANATINNNIGSLEFFGASRAGSATISNNDLLQFSGTATADSATITNNAGAALRFFGASSAGSAAVTNSGTAQFFENSTAGAATITNNGTVQFFANSTAGTASITNDGAGVVEFSNTSTAGSAVIANNGNGTVRFLDTGTAGSASITNNGVLHFFNTSTAGTATITNNGVLQFLDTSTAGNAAITNNNVNTGMAFRGNSTAGNATITNNGVLDFHETSTAGSATITNNDRLIFREASTAGSAAITNNALLQFGNSSTGGTARLINGAAGTIDLSALTNLGMTAGSIEGAGFILLGSNNLAVGGNNLSTTFSGVLQDGGAGSGTGGSLTKTGTGTLTLAGNNTYTGGTTVNAGVLQLGNGGTTGAILGDVLNNATLAFNRSNAYQFDGAISGSGGVQQNGGGTTILTAANTYTGATRVDAGTLQAGAANAFAPVSAFTVADGATLDLNGFNQTIGSLAGVGAVSLGSATLTTGNDDTSTIFAGAITGTGGLTKIGAGTFTLSGINLYSGNTNVNGGTLLVNGSIASSILTTVNAGGTLGGNGTVGNTVINGGTLAAGNSIGTLTVSGSLVMTAASTYLVEVSPTNADRTNVTGTATLGGTVQAVFAPGSYVTRSYTILSATGGLGGTNFSGLTIVPAGFTADLSYTSTDVLLNLTAALGTDGALNQNQRNVATAINGFFNNGGALPPNFVNLFGLTGGNLAHTLSLLSGEAATGARQGAFQLGGQFLGLMLDPFVDGRGGIAVAGGPALGFAPEREALPDSVALAYAKVTKAPPYNKAAPVAFEQRWTAWGGAFGGYNRTGGDPAVIGSHDLTARTAGFAAGLDYHFSRDAVFGFALAGGGTNWSLADGLGGGKSDAFQAGVYAAARSGPAYLAASLAFAHHWMSTDRNAAFGNHLTAEFNARSIGARVESGYRVGTPASAITPYAALQAQSFHTPTYSETDVDGGGFGLTYNTRTAHDIRGELGARFDHVALVDPGAVLTLRSRLAWAHDWVSDPSLAAVFQALPGASFIVTGATPAKDSALASAGAELKLANGVTLIGKLDGEFASRAQTYTGTGTVRWAW